MLGPQGQKAWLLDLSMKLSIFTCNSTPPFLLMITACGSAVKNNLTAMQETRGRSLGQEDPLETGMATHSSTLAWRIPRTEEPGGLQSMGSQRVSDRLSD